MTPSSKLVKRKKKFKFAKCDDKAVKMFDLSMQQRKKVKRIQKADEKHITRKEFSKHQGFLR